MSFIVGRTPIKLKFCVRLSFGRVFEIQITRFYRYCWLYNIKVNRTIQWKILNTVNSSVVSLIYSGVSLIHSLINTWLGSTFVYNRPYWFTVSDVWMINIPIRLLYLLTRYIPPNPVLSFVYGPDLRAQGDFPDG